jgi:hypothetical protein
MKQGNGTLQRLRCFGSPVFTRRAPTLFWIKLTTPILGLEQQTRDTLQFKKASVRSIARMPFFMVRFCLIKPLVLPELERKSERLAKGKNGFVKQELNRQPSE